MQHVIKRTHAAAYENKPSDAKPSRADLELKLIQSKKDIENPEIVVKCMPLSS